MQHRARAVKYATPLMIACKLAVFALRFMQRVQMTKKTQCIVPYMFSNICSAIRMHSICDNPIPEWQSRIGMRWIFNERSDTVCTTIFGMDFFFAGIFGRTRA